MKKKRGRVHSSLYRKVSMTGTSVRDAHLDFRNKYDSNTASLRADFKPVGTISPNCVPQQQCTTGLTETRGSRPS